MTRQHYLMKRWRGRETDYFAQMADLLPLPVDIKSQLKKPAILRMSAAYIKTKHLEDMMGGTFQSLEDADEIIHALGGFLMTVDGSGMILSVSDSVHTILGHNYYEMVGSSILEFLHPDDYSYFYSQMYQRKAWPPHFNGLFSGWSTSVHCEFVVRFKYKIGGKVHKVKQTGFVSLQFCGLLKTYIASGVRSHIVLVVACYPHCLALCKEMGFPDARFVMRFDNKSRFSYIDEGFRKILGTRGKELIGIDIKECLHPNEAKGSYSIINKLYHQRGAMILKYVGITRAGQMFHAVSRETMVYGPKGEKLFSVDVDSISRRKKVRVKHWPIKTDIIFITQSYGLPGEDQVSVGHDLGDVLDLNYPPKHTDSDDESNSDVDDESGSSVDGTVYGDTAQSSVPDEGKLPKDKAPILRGVEFLEFVCENAGNLNRSNETDLNGTTVPHNSIETLDDTHTVISSFLHEENNSPSETEMDQADLSVSSVSTDDVSHQNSQHGACQQQPLMSIADKDRAFPADHQRVCHQQYMSDAATNGMLNVISQSCESNGVTENEMLNITTPSCERYGATASEVLGVMAPNYEWYDKNSSEVPHSLTGWDYSTMAVSPPVSCDDALTASMIMAHACVSAEAPACSSDNFSLGHLEIDHHLGRVDTCHNEVTGIDDFPPEVLDLVTNPMYFPQYA